MVDDAACFGTTKCFSHSGPVENLFINPFAGLAQMLCKDQTKFFSTLTRRRKNAPQPSSWPSPAVELVWADIFVFQDMI